jgi:hypothetical protein
MEWIEYQCGGGDILLGGYDLPLRLLQSFRITNLTAAL